MDQVYRGVVPFFLLQILALLIVLAWPEPFTFLPRLMIR
jgi:TRAP-type mannitol/chloroaromatic compound transport system permease large subunit